MIAYASSCEGVTVEDLRGFFAGWPNPPALERRVEVARDSKSGRVIGFGVALTDGVLTAYVSLVGVLPEYRGGASAVSW